MLLYLVLFCFGTTAIAQTPNEEEEEESSFKNWNASYDAEKVIEVNAQMMEVPSFACKWVEKTIVMRWQSKDSNIQAFIVQHSTDGVTYSNSTSLPKSANGHYRYESFAYNAGNNYFRLMQVNKDGTVFVNKGINVMCGMDGAHTLDLEATSFYEETQVTLQVRNEQKVILEILDKNGNVVKELYNGQMSANEIIFRDIKGTTLAAGKYYVSMRGEYFKESKKIEILK